MLEIKSNPQLEELLKKKVLKNLASYDKNYPFLLNQQREKWRVGKLSVIEFLRFQILSRQFRGKNVPGFPLFIKTARLTYKRFFS